MMLMRLNRKPGEKGVGPNRDDHPHFTAMCDAWLTGQPIEKDFWLAGHHRVQKYSRQLSVSPYKAWIDDPKTEVSHLIHEYQKLRSQQKADEELHELIEQAKGPNYGNW